MPSKPLVTGARRTDLWYVDPTTIVIRHDLRGRSREVEEDAIKRMAVSLLENGQIQPVEVRRDGETILLSLGFTRTAAGCIIRNGFTDEAGVFRQDKKFVLKVQLVNCTEQEAFIRNVVENAVRNQTSPIDDALNQEKLRDRYGWDNRKIAEVYGRSLASISKFQQLLTLDLKYQEMVHQGDMPVQAALDLKKVPPEEREQVVKEATNGSGKVKGAAVVKKARAMQEKKQEEKQAAPEPTVAERVVYHPRSAKELKDFLHEASPKLGDDGKRLCKALVEFVEGKRSDKAMFKVLEELRRAE